MNMNMDTKELHSTELYQSSCAKAVILPKAMEQVENQFMAASLPMKTLF